MKLSRVKSCLIQCRDATLLYFCYAMTAYANKNGADEIFAPLDEKTSGFADALRLFGWTVAGLIVVVCGILAMMDKFPKDKFKDVLLGCALLIVGTQFVAFMAS